MAKDVHGLLSDGKIIPATPRKDGSMRKPQIPITFGSHVALGYVTEKENGKLNIAAGNNRLVVDGVSYGFTVNLFPM